MTCSRLRPALRLATLLAPLLAGAHLAGCGVFAPTISGQPPSPEQAACESQADASPVVREIMNKMVGNMHYQREHEDELRAAKQDATVACLRARGIVRPGGVERQKPLR